ncbi:hypothetical protein N9W97_02950 [Pseudomonadales bacterium]|nr:hypothetical protein [Pseudomonadales bacterium]
MKVLVLGFGMTPLFLKELIEKTRNEEIGVDFSVILSSSHHLEPMLDLLGENKVLCIDRELPKYKNKEIDLSKFSSYPDNVYKNIESQKVTMKDRDSKTQMNIAYWTYSLLKAFVLKISPDHILYIQSPEDMEGMILGGLAHELDIPLAIPHHTRHIGLSFFSFHRQEILPSAVAIKQTHIDQAYQFLSDFRNGITTAACFKNDRNEMTHIPYNTKGKMDRLMSGISRYFKESESRELRTLQISLLNNWFPLWRDLYRGWREFVNKRVYNCESIERLPKRFIFYPIQYSPESSINIPSPYFIDQLRVIDAIRMSMPSDYSLVVKEHPVCISVRPRKFIKALLNKAGVVVARYDLDTQEVIKKSKVVISVTGTAALEAFLNGKPSLVMGPTFFSDYLGGICKIDELPERIRDIADGEVDEDVIIKFLSEVLSVSSDFLGRSPGEGNDKMMTYENLNAFWDAFKQHASREYE